MEGKPIRNLDQAAQLTLGDVLVFAQADGRTRKGSLEQLRQLINSLGGGADAQTAQQIVDALDVFFAGTGWRDGTGVAAPKLTRFQASPTINQRSVTIDFTPDPNELIVAFRNGSLIEPASRTGRTFTYPGPDFQIDETVTILAYPE